jgi:glyoxylase-like metal-dependent hydrolase (beta-lactamase superfamily II)
VKAVLLPHAHLDHNDNTGLLDNAIPIVATSTLPRAMTGRRIITYPGICTVEIETML